MAKLLKTNILNRVFCQYNNCSYKFLSSTASNDYQKQHYDVIIAGGGLVGVSLAVSLAQSESLAEKKVLLLESAPAFKQPSKEKYSNRVSAINKQSIGLLKSLNAWNHIESIRCKPVMQMQVWDAISGEAIHFNHPNFSDQVACIVENDLILESLYKQLENLLNVQVRNESRLESCKLPKDDVKKSEVTLKSGEQFSCDLLIGADGANSIVRQKMEVNNFALSYKQMGVVATLELDAEEAAGNSVAWQRFLPTGPVALLPLTDKLSSLVWSTNVEHAKELLRMEPEMFIENLNEAYLKSYKTNSLVDKFMKTAEGAFPLGRNKMLQVPPRVKNLQEGSRAAFPLGFGHASSYVCRGAALIGDAAHRVHPLAGQGVNLGFGDVLKLTEILSEAVYSGSSLDNIQYLLKYEQERLKANVPIMVGIHALQQLYCNDFPPFVLARSLGLKITNFTPPLKKFFMEKALA
ncbi:CLUMA_CG020006, isoform A [Clunio marinus]|uniref:Ubiquinone biosynthesis monooxygenase COQ6, mitochondrial n=1 Tax=Clunio marinus TaxID=568069 RepID=A0A1J1J3R1_9DIPT|nr:CLUMA_CG020006, isoform A [Clunio marinus]